MVEIDKLKSLVDELLATYSLQTPRVRLKNKIKSSKIEDINFCIIKSNLLVLKGFKVLERVKLPPEYENLEVSPKFVKVWREMCHKYNVKIDRSLVLKRNKKIALRENSIQGVIRTIFYWYETNTNKGKMKQ